MKKQLRKITINNAEFLYTISQKYQPSTKTNLLTIKVFLCGQKLTPLFIDFLTLDDYYLGNLLFVGTNLPNSTTNETTYVNLNKPKFIREFVLMGLKHGWTGTNKVEVQNGMNYLKELGFEVSKLQAEG